ncbi:hypothetical protein OAS39_09400 [Pirellulales bacterium]|nr:hypothetical protein [Pirellulales bacterium]
MGRKFAGILTLIVTSVVLVQAIRDGAQLESAMIAVIAWSIGSAAAGWLIGAIAESTVEESARTTLEAELAAIAPPQAPASEPATS